MLKCSLRGKKRDNGEEVLFEKKMDEYFPEVMKGRNPLIKEVQCTQTV